jgi:uncharacterized protein YdhG (YjbR/CyaY superfamily)
MNEIDQYLASQPERIKEILSQIRETIKEAVPEAEELISYQMPAFKYHGILAWYAPFKKRYSLFVRPQFLEPFKEELKQYKLAKSAVHFQYDQPVPVDLIRRIVLRVAGENLAKRK